MTVQYVITLIRSVGTGPRARDGATALEFALVLPSMLLAVYGILEIGRLLFVYGMLFIAAEEATRFATVNYDATVADIQTVANDSLVLVEPASITNFDVQSNLDPNDQTKLVSVEITYAYETLMPMPWGTITLLGSSRGFIIDE